MKPTELTKGNAQMSSVIIMPKIKIGDYIEVKYGNRFKIFKLNDIACWSKDHSIKTIEMIEQEIKYSWNYPNKKEFNDAKNKLRQKADLIFKSGDKLLIDCSHDSVPYTIDVDTWNDEIRTVHFRKMIQT